MDYNYYAPRNQTWRYSYAHRNEEFPVGTVSEFEINEEDWNNNAIDVLDLDVMAKKFEEHRRLQQTEKQNGSCFKLSHTHVAFFYCGCI